MAGLGAQAQPCGPRRARRLRGISRRCGPGEILRKRWTIPAKVYARPLELFTGQKLSKDDFLTELDALGYRREPVSNGPGAAAVSGNTVDLNTRGFQFYEGLEKAQPVRVRFSGDYVAELSSLNGSKTAGGSPGTPDDRRDLPEEP